MIEPTDDDERTNSLGLFNTAEAYRLSAMALPKIEHRHAEKLRRFLYYHALELYLKALLRQEHSMATVRDKFGHKIKLLVREAETLGLVVSEEGSRRARAHRRRRRDDRLALYQNRYTCAKTSQGKINGKVGI